MPFHVSFVNAPPLALYILLSAIQKSSFFIPTSNPSYSPLTTRIPHEDRPRKLSPFLDSPCARLFTLLGATWNLYDKRTIQTIRYHNAWREFYRIHISLVFFIVFSNGGLSSVDAIDKKCSPRFARLRDIIYQRDIFFSTKNCIVVSAWILVWPFWLILYFPSLGQAKCPSHHGATCNVRLLTPCPAYYLFNPLERRIYNMNLYLVSNHSKSVDLDGPSRSDESDAHTMRRIDRHLSIKTARIGA